MSGMSMARCSSDPVRFLTLTTSDLQAQTIDFDNGSMNKSFRKLRYRISRITPAKLVQQVYVTTAKARIFYKDLNWLSTLPFDYFKVETNEGNGVLHIVYKGEYLPYDYLVDNWQDIHNSWDVNIKLIDNSKKDLKKASTYIVSQYISHQDSSYVRSSQSWGWVYRGFKRDWRSLCSWYYKWCSDWPDTGKHTRLPLLEYWNNRLSFVACPEEPPPVQYPIECFGEWLV